MEIVLDSEAGIKLAAKLPEELKVDLKFEANASTKITVRAKY